MKTSYIDSLGYYEMKQHKPWSDECSKLLDGRKQAKLQCLQNPGQQMEIILTCKM
jgi:hypothetical protein